jgi:hypothetical protein
MKLGPGDHLHGLTLPGGVKGEDFDYFHELVLNQELGESISLVSALLLTSTLMQEHLQSVTCSEVHSSSRWLPDSHGDV